MKNKLKFKHQPRILKYILAGFLILAAPAFMQAQTKVITGIVSDENKLPIPGATITVKGTKTAVSTSSDGQYKIQASETDQLVFSFVGFNSKTVSVGTKSSINISLESSTTGLDEVVVVGYATVKKKDLTGSVGSVTMTDLQKAPVRSFDEALAGRVAGVQVTSGDGQPGSGVNIVIRGNNSVTQANSPLYVVDGFPIENMDNNSLNPQDIESIDILKDASATAIYGARGANGVIVVTTKKGKTGPPVFSFENSTSLQQSMSTMKLLDPYEFVKLQLEIDPSPTGTPPYKSARELYLPPGASLDDYKKIDGINWQEKVLRPAIMQNYNASVSGGTKKTKYSLSANYVDQDGIIIASNYSRAQSRLVIDHQLTKKLKIGINTNFSHLRQSGSSPSQSSFSATNNAMYSVWGYRPVTGTGLSPQELDDNALDSDINRAFDFRVQPAINLRSSYRASITDNLTSNGYLEYEILSGLKLRVSGGIVINKHEVRVFNDSKTGSGNPTSANGVNGRIDHNDYKNWLNENTLTWNKKFNKHNLNLLGGFTWQKQTSTQYGFGGIKIPDETLGLKGLDTGTIVRVDTFNSLWTMTSFLSRVNYNYDSRYFLTASMRADGSSKFPKENHWGYFPSGAISWKFNNEKFLKGSKIISDGKLRASYGQTGNNRVGDFDYITKFYNPIDKSYVFDNQYVDGVIPNSLGNSKLKWETTEQVDLGLDLGFFKQRITLSTEVYRKRTIDLLLQADLPASSGFSTAIKNVGAMENKGLEFTLNTVNVKTPSFTWNTSFNIAFNRNKVLALSDNQTDLKTIITWETSYNNIPYSISTIGQPVGQMYGYTFDGTYKISDFDQPTPGVYALKADVIGNGNVRANIRPGDMKLKDITGDGQITADDAGVIGQSLPKHTGGFTNNFAYKGFDLNVFFQWSYGNDVMNANRIFFESGNNANLNQFASFADRWTFENPDSNIPRVRGTVGAIAGYTSRTVEDASYLRLKTVSLGYTFNNELTRRLKLKSLRLYASAQNLVTWTKYSGPDPEVNVYPTVLKGGFDYSAYPRARVMTLGAKITF